MQVLETIIAVVVVLSILFFLIYMAGLLRMPSGYRPETPTFNRFGDALPPRQNPGYRETEDEQESDSE